MSSRLRELDVIVRHVWSDPRLVAQMEWWRDHPLPSMWLEVQVGRGAMEQFAAGGGWPDPDRVVSFVRYGEPDWDWWEPTSEWRRKAARDRELDAILAAIGGEK